jgi:hypothetical protein
MYPTTSTRIEKEIGFLSELINSTNTEYLKSLPTPIGKIHPIRNQHPAAAAAAHELSPSR